MDLRGEYCICIHFDSDDATTEEQSPETNTTEEGSEGNLQRSVLDEDSTEDESDGKEGISKDEKTPNKSNSGEDKLAQNI